MTLMDRLRWICDRTPGTRVYENEEAIRKTADALDDALAIASELARLARCMDAPPERSIGTQVALLEDLERRVGVRA